MPALTLEQAAEVRQLSPATAKRYWPYARAWLYQAIAENPGPVEQFRGGKDGALNAVVGQVMKKSGGSANPKLVQDLLRQRLSGP